MPLKHNERAPGLGRGRKRSLAGAAVAAVIAVVVAGIYAATNHSSTSAPSTSWSFSAVPKVVVGPRGEDWLVSTAALHMLAPTFVTALADSPYTFLIVNKQQLTQVPAGTKAMLVAAFDNYSALESTLNQGHLSSRFRGVLFDDEAWTLTPGYQQKNVAKYEQKAAELAHSHGLFLIATPGVDLTRVLDRGGPGTAFQKYLNLGIAGDAARYADVIDIQAQSTQAQTAEYTSFVAAAAVQARAANPNVVVLAGLSTNRPGPAITVSKLAAAVRSTHAIVNGYWLNIPVPGRACSYCHAPEPGLADGLLQQFPLPSS